jgi:putative membrane-bound dehydrogenase-like protein
MTRRLIYAATLLATHLYAQEPAVLLEGEQLKVLKHTGQARPQDLHSYRHITWTGMAHLWWTGAKPGDVLELALPVAKDGEYRLGAGFTKAVDYGVFEFALDGQPLAGPIDLFSTSVMHAGTVPLGKAITLKAGEHRVSITVKGANAAAKKSYMLGLDYVVLAAGADADVVALAKPFIVTQPSKPAAPETKPQRDISYNNLEVQPLKAAEQRKKFTVPEGFKVELVASEETGLPKPTMVAFDDAGRMWSASATAYPCDKDNIIWTQPGKDRIVVFDTPTARTPQTARTFAEGMVMPVSVLPHGKGVFVAQGPEIFYLDDRNGDGHADERRVLAKGFGVQDTHTVPHQLTWMPGGRVTFSQGLLNSGRMTDAEGKIFVFNRTLVASMKPDGTDTRILSAGLNNIWAWAHGRTGRVFIHEANDLGYSVVPFEEDSTYPGFVAMKLHPSSPIHPPTAQDLNLGGTGFSGLAICDDKSGSFPAPWHGLLYIANPILGKIHAVAATLDARGVWTFEKRGDLVSCADPMFRPVAITFGPDGCLYITDWYNRIISHNEIPRDHPARDKERGRVWRIRHSSQSSAKVPDMTRVPASELPAHLKADSTWEMRAAWHQIGQRGGKELIPAITQLAADVKTSADARIHALWSLEELGHFDAALWTTFLADASHDLRREAVRSLSTLKIGEDAAFDLLQPLAAEREWTVRYEVLRFFRRAAGPVNPAHIAWLKRWSANPAPKTEVKGWNGTYLALGGSYERAFLDFLLSLAETKSPAAVLNESKWDKTIATAPEPTAEDVAALAKRIAAVKALLPNAKPDQGRPIVESTCLACHSAGGIGFSLAPPLDGSSKRDTDGLLTAILAPDAAIEQVFRLYRIETLDGGKFEGFKKNESDKDITLMLMGGATQAVPIAKIKSAGYVAGKSVMLPFAAGFSDAQLADIVRYLQTLQ